MPRPHRARRAGGGRAVRHRRGLDEHRAPLARAAAAGVARSCAASPRSSPASRAPRSAPRRRVPWQELAADYDRIRERIAHVVPGFDDFNHRVREPGGFLLPNGARDAPLRDAATGARASPCTRCPTHALAAGRFLLMTIRSHDQFNTTIYGYDDRYRGIYGRAPRGVPARATTSRAPASRAGAARRPHQPLPRRDAPRRAASARVPYDLPRGCAAAYFPEANALVAARQRRRRAAARRPTSRSRSRSPRRR